MLKPRIFVSAVTREFQSTRQLVVNTLIALGYEPVWQDIFETSADDIRPMLRKKLDRCSAVLQIVGDVYSAEPPQPDSHFGRCSYTQFEAKYAQSQGKPVYYLIAGPEHPRDAAPETLDLPVDDSPAAQADAAERRRLQAEYRANCQASERIFYLVTSHDETELRVRKLDEAIAKLRRGIRNWMLGVSVALLVIVGGVLWLNRGQQQQGEQLGEVKQSVDEQTQELKELAARLDDPEQLRASLVKTIQQTYDKAIQEAMELLGWREREQAKELATSQRDQHLGRVDDWLNSILAEIRSGNASPEYLELIRITQDEGAAEAVAYILSRKPDLLERFDRDQQTNRERNLLPLLEAVRQQTSLGEYEAARSLCDELLAKDPFWGDALYQQFWIVAILGDQARQYETITTAEMWYRAAEKLARQKSEFAPDHPESQRDLSISHDRLGDVLLQMGQPQQALQHFEDGLKIRQTLAAADPRNAHAQRDLSVSHEKLGNVLLQMGQPQQAFQHYEDGLKIRQTLAAADPRNAESQRDLSVSHNKLGDVLLQMGQPQQALQHYEDFLQISKTLAAVDPRDARAQRDLSVSHNNLGNVLLQMGQPQQALQHYEQCHQVLVTLAAADERDAQAQRDVSISHNNLGDVLRQMSEPQQALQHYENGLKISQTLAVADERDARAQRGLMVSRYKLGRVQRELGELILAKEAFQGGIAILDRLIATGQNVEQSQNEKAVLEHEITTCDTLIVATGDWETLVQQPAEQVPDLLAYRCTWLAKQGKLAEVQQAADTLLTLEQKSTVNLYNAACGYGLCLKLVSGWSGRGPFPPAGGIPEGTAEEQTQRAEYRQQALNTLKAAIDAGYVKYDHIRADSDLKALHNDPEFEALFPQ